MPYPPGVFKALVVIGLLAAVAWYAFDMLRQTDPDRLPQPTQVVVPDPPDVSFDVHTP
jgi:hypothetical protein